MTPVSGVGVQERARRLRSWPRARIENAEDRDRRAEPPSGSWSEPAITPRPRPPTAEGIMKPWSRMPRPSATMPSAIANSEADFVDDRVEEEAARRGEDGDEDRARHAMDEAQARQADRQPVDRPIPDVVEQHVQPSLPRPPFIGAEPRRYNITCKEKVSENLASPSAGWGGGRPSGWWRGILADALGVKTPPPPSPTAAAQPVPALGSPPDCRPAYTPLPTRCAPGEAEGWPRHWQKRRRPP